MRISIPAYVGRVLEELHKGAHEAYVVGGCVRDSLLGREPADWDVTTSALPEETLEVFTKAGFRLFETGLKHGTVTVISDGPAGGGHHLPGGRGLFRQPAPG